MARGTPGKTLALLDGNGKLNASVLGIPGFYFYAEFSGATTSWTIATMEFKVRILGAHSICTAANVNGTVRVDNGSSAITDALTCATNKEVDYAATIDDDYYELNKGDTLKLTTANSAAGQIYIWAMRAE